MFLQSERILARIRQIKSLQFKLFTGANSLNQVLQCTSIPTVATVEFFNRTMTLWVMRRLYFLISFFRQFNV